MPVMAGHKLQFTNKNTEHKKRYKTTNKTCSFSSPFPVYHFFGREIHGNSACRINLPATRAGLEFG